MLYHLLYPLSEQYHLLNVFKYLTFRGASAILTALVICFLIGPKMIKYFRALQKQGQPIRHDGPSQHLLTKKGTPTMGGLMILLSAGISTLLWTKLDNIYVWIVLFVTMGLGLLGFLDDYLKVKKQTSEGVPGKVKLVWQATVALIACYLIQQQATGPYVSHLAIPFLKTPLIDLGWFYLPFAMIVVVGSSNAVNLTDGLDGLAIVPIMIVAGCFTLIAYLVGHSEFASYLQLQPVPGTGELVVFCGAIIGAGLGFLWFNAPPAKIFMGDTGSLSLGGALGAISVITKHELVLAITGGIFVMEAVSVMLQVGSFKLRGKRIFKMAPIHHHFEKKGWAEATIVIRFWIISVILALIGLSTLKLR